MGIGRNIGFGLSGLMRGFNQVYWPAMEREKDRAIKEELIEFRERAEQREIDRIAEERKTKKATSHFMQHPSLMGQPFSPEMAAGGQQQFSVGDIGLPTAMAIRKYQDYQTPSDIEASKIRIAKAKLKPKTASEKLAEKRLKDYTKPLTPEQKKASAFEQFKKKESYKKLSQEKKRYVDLYWKLIGKALSFEAGVGIVAELEPGKTEATAKAKKLAERIRKFAIEKFGIDPEAFGTEETGTGSGVSVKDMSDDEVLKNLGLK